MARKVNRFKVNDEPHSNCSICLEQYKEPKLLPCGHTFCLRCLEGIDTQRSNKLPSSRQNILFRLSAVVKICCPDCSRNHTLPKIGVSGFATDYIVIQEVETHTWQVEMESKIRESKCGMCGMSDKTYSLCSECDSFLCSFCSSAHERMKIFETHQVQQMTTPVIDIKSFKPKSKPVLCQDHFPTPVSMYCKKCQLLICTECITKPLSPSVSGDSHSGHTLHSLTDSTLETFEETFLESLGRAEVEEQKLADLLQVAKIRETKLKKYPELLKKAVNDTIDQSIRVLENMREEAIVEIDENQKVILEKAFAHKETILSKVSSLKSEIRFAEKAFSCTEKSRRIAMLSHASSVLQADPFQSLNVHHDFSTMNVVQDLQHNLQELKLLVGFDPSLVRISESAAKLNVISSIIVKSEAQTLLTPKFRILYRKVRLPITVLEKDKYTWQLQFTPCYIGSHVIKIKVFDTWYSLQPQHRSFHGLGEYLQSHSFHVSGELKEGDIVRPIPDDSHFKDLDKSQLEKTGKIKSVSSSWSNKGNTRYHTVVVVWEYESESAKEEKFSFTRLVSSAESFPFEFVY